MLRQPMDAYEVQRRLLEREPLVRRFINSRIGSQFRSQISTDDVLQEVWTAAFRHGVGNSFDNDNGFDRWLLTIASTKIADAIRAAARNAKLAAPPQANGRRRSLSFLLGRFPWGGRTPSRATATREAADAVTNALQSLPNDRRRAVQLRHIEGKSHAEIAELMKKSVAAVNSLIFNGLRELRERLGDPSRFFSGSMRGERSRDARDSEPSSDKVVRDADSGLT